MFDVFSQFVINMAGGRLLINITTQTDKGVDTETVERGGGLHLYK